MTKPVFPDNFVALRRYPGYYWNTEDKCLYTLKQTGVLKRLTVGVISANWNLRGRVDPYGRHQIGDTYYRISHDGKKKNLYVKNINYHLQANKVVPVAPFQGELF